MKNNKKNIIIISVSIIIVLILVIIGCMIIKSNNNKEINNFKIQTKKDFLDKNGIISLFPLIDDEEISDLHGLDFLLNVSNDINKKTEKDNRYYETCY